MDGLIRLKDKIKKFVKKKPEKVGEVYHLLATYIACTSDANTDVSQFVHMATKVAVNWLEDIETFDPRTIAKFLEKGVELVRFGPLLSSMSLSKFLSLGIRKITDCLDYPFRQSRYRVYTIHAEDEHGGSYWTFISAGMPGEYQLAHDVDNPDRFLKTTRINLEHPPYERVKGTNCYIIDEHCFDDDRFTNWHPWLKEIKLGDNKGGVPKTYTWEFTNNGVSEILCWGASEERKKEFTLAFSMDAGPVEESYENRVIILESIKLIDTLWASSFGRDMGACFGSIIRNSKQQEIESGG